jgi:hypothetical protein
MHHQMAELGRMAARAEWQSRAQHGLVSSTQKSQARLDSRDFHMQKVSGGVQWYAVVRIVVLVCAEQRLILPWTSSLEEAEDCVSLMLFHY